MEYDFTKPAPQAKTLKEAQKLIDVLWALCAEMPKLQQRIEEQQQRINDLEERLNTNSQNSSKPPSTDKPGPKPKKKKKKKRNRGGQPGHTGQTRNLLPESEVDMIEKHHPPEKCGCGGQIVETDWYKRHQIHDLPPIKTVVTEHKLFYGCCVQCDKQHCAQLPDEVPSGMLGPGLLAIIAVLTGDYQMSKRSIRRLLGDLFGLLISIGTVKRAEETVSAALKAPIEEAQAYVQTQNSVNCDETSHFECGDKKWVWVAIASHVAVMIIAGSRSRKAAKELLGEAFSSILCSDRYSAYSWLPAEMRQVCWAHLKRDFNKIYERTGKSKEIGFKLLACTRLMFIYWHKYRQGLISRKKLKGLMHPLQDKVETLLKSGLCTRNSKTQGTCAEILKVKAALWNFINHENIEPTNNLAERVLRQIVIWRKICFGTWSENGSTYLARIMSVVATCRLQKRSVFGYVYDVIKAQLMKEAPPSLLPTREEKVEISSKLIPVAA